MSTPLSRAAAMHDATVAQLKAECARYLEYAEEILTELAQHSENGEKTLLQGIRSRIDADRVKLLPEGSEDVVPIKRSEA